MSVYLECVEKWYEVNFNGEIYKIIVENRGEYPTSIRIYDKEITRLDIDEYSNVIDYFYDNLNAE